MTKHLKIDFVSDVACPWCAIGLAGLRQALANLNVEIDAEFVFHPFELNPQMPAGGQNFAEHVVQKYGSSPAQLAANQKNLIARAAEAGFDMAVTTDSRIYNTFDAHRLIHWAGLKGRQMEMKQILFEANFTRNGDVGDANVLEDAAVRAGLDPEESRAVIHSDHYADEVRAEIDEWRARGVTSVPTMLIDDKYLLTGGQPAEEFERLLRQIASAA
jgi:predicted DsbA family dithiol-disulfide isomerase